MVFFCEANIPQSVLNNDKDREQFDRLQQARRRFQEKGLLGTYKDPSDLRLQFSRYATNIVNEIRSASTTQATQRATTTATSAPMSAQIHNKAPDFKFISCEMVETRHDRNTLFRDMITGTERYEPPPHMFYADAAVYRVQGSIYVTPKSRDRLFIVKRECKASFASIPRVRPESDNVLRLEYIEPAQSSKTIDRTTEEIIIDGPGMITFGGTWITHLNHYGPIPMEVVVQFHMPLIVGETATMACELSAVRPGVGELSRWMMLNRKPT
jgi:hypothetical protein